LTGGALRSRHRVLRRVGRLDAVADSEDVDTIRVDAIDRAAPIRLVSRTTIHQGETRIELSGNFSIRQKS
jgi:hypothetical protein